MRSARLSRFLRPGLRLAFWACLSPLLALAFFVVAFVVLGQQGSAVKAVFIGLSFAAPVLFLGSALLLVRAEAVFRPYLVCVLAWLLFKAWTRTGDDSSALPANDLLALLESAAAFATIACLLGGVSRLAKNSGRDALAASASRIPLRLLVSLVVAFLAVQALSMATSLGLDPVPLLALAAICLMGFLATAVQGARLLDLLRTAAAAS
ncbi:MAG: hypothetical protein H8E31_07960 [Planctomycetes bacterium]|nr:hypothetical protein [Planctomycetota bacterium]